MPERPRPVPMQVRSDVDRVMYALVDLDRTDDDFDWHVRRLAESCYAAGYEDGHTAGSTETFSREFRKRERDRLAKASDDDA